MKRWILILSGILGVGGLLWVASDHLKNSKAETAQAKPDFMAGSQLWIEGNSSLKRYSLTLDNFSAKSDLNTSDSSMETLLALILNRQSHKLIVTLPVKGLKSGDSRMDSIAYGKLKAEEFPDIVFKLENYVVKPFPGSLFNYALLVTGTLTIAGVEREVVLDPIMVLGKDGINLYGSQDVFQKDFGITPYSLAVVVTTDNKIVVHYLIHLALT
jgi:hypothetical protein